MNKFNKRSVKHTLQTTKHFWKKLKKIHINGKTSHVQRLKCLILRWQHTQTDLLDSIQSPTESQLTSHRN